jgi:hypothetical protein
LEYTEAVRQIIDGNLLSDIVSLPRNFMNKKVDIEAMIKGSVTESLIGALPCSGYLVEMPGERSDEAFPQRKARFA